MTKRGRLIVLSGPSGVGKTTVADILCATGRFVESVSATTRDRRGDEIAGRHYHYLSSEEFDRRVKAGEFLEHAIVHDHRYGTLRAIVERVLDGGSHCILSIDVQGASQIFESGVDTTSVFLLPPSFETLEQRLRDRSTDSEVQIRKRLDTARHELSRQHDYDHRVVNAVAAEAAAEIERLLATEVSSRSTGGDGS